jgi:hypothetical protein
MRTHDGTPLGGGASHPCDAKTKRARPLLAGPVRVAAPALAYSSTSFLSSAFRPFTE